jgi:phage/plasmid-like protein (TIGR03299 family)
MIDYSKMAEANGLGWNVTKEPMYTLSPSGVVEPTSYYAVKRDDNGDVLNCVTGRYAPFQNSSLFELADAVANDTNLPVHRAGELSGGRIVFVQLLDTTLNGIGRNNDKVDSYVTCLNSHDGSRSIAWGSTSITISCKNTFNHAFKEMNNKAKHTLNAVSRIQENIAQANKLRERNKEFERSIMDLDAIEIDQNIINRYVTKLTGIDVSISEDELRSTLHGKAVNRVQDILKSVHSECAYKGYSLWGMWSGITHYTTHVAGRDNSREVSKLSGASQTLDERAFRLASEYVNIYA